MENNFSNNNGCCSYSNDINNNYDNSNNNLNKDNNNFVKKYDFLISPITNDNEFIKKIVNKNINDLINEEINKFRLLTKTIRKLIPKKNNLIQLLISNGVEIPNDPSKIVFIYRVIISKKEFCGIFYDNYSRIKLILNKLKGIIGIFQEVDNENEVILGFADVDDISCEFVLLAVCKLIQKYYDKVEIFNKKIT